MKSALVSMFAYKAWANRLLLASLQEFQFNGAPECYQKILGIYDHVQLVDAIFQSHLLAKPPGYSDTQSPVLPELNELQRRVSASDGWYSEFVSQLSETKLDQIIHFQFTDGQAGSMSVQEILWHVISHAAYHRGSMAQLLEDQGYASPADSLTKFLHYTEPHRRHSSSD